jgi:hypothetical protein
MGASGRLSMNRLNRPGGCEKSAAAQYFDRLNRLNRLFLKEEEIHNIESPFVLLPFSSPRDPPGVQKGGEAV